MPDFEHALMLDPEGTDAVVDTVAEYLEQEKYEHDDALRLRL